MVEDMYSGIIRPEENNQLKDMIEELNSDTTENDGFSKIDMRTRLNATEIPAIVAVDVAVSMGAFPLECNKITRSKKRVAVSLNGQGRSEMVNMVRSEITQQENKSMLDKMQGK